MPDAERFTALLEALADGTPVDWAAVEAAATDGDELTELRRLRRLELAVSHQRRSPERAATWSHLELIGKIGAGAFGEVYRAHDPRLARDVALKLLYEPMLADDSRASAVIEEGRLLARVRHPNVVTVYGAECRDGQVGIWTEFIDGHTLQAIVAERGPLPQKEVVSIGVDLCRALAAVHGAGLLHRDIKAQNVMREGGGRIVLMDFGTGRDLDPLPRQRTDVSGTPLYLAPELFKGGEASAASDIYSLGVLLFFLLTGRHPVSGTTLRDVQTAHRDGRPDLVSTMPPGVCIELRTAVETALSLEPSRRHESAGAFERALLPVPTAMGDRAGAGSSRSRRPDAALIAVGVVCALALAAWAAWTLSHDGTSPVPRASRDSQSSRAWAGPDVRTEGSVSPDGRLLSAVSPDGGLMLHDFESRADRILVKADSPGILVGESAISKDGASVAYAWYGDNSAQVELRAVSTAPGAAPSRTVLSDANVNWIVPFDWSPDGQFIAVSLERHDRTVHLALISVSDHTVTELKPIDWRGTTRMAFSPDGRFVAYDLATGDSPDRDVYVMDVGTHEETPAVVRAGNDTLAGWADGSTLVFLSDRSGQIGVWTVPFVEHGSAGRAAVAKSVLDSRAYAIGLTSTGTLVYGVQASHQNIFTAEVDFQTGKLLRGPAEVTESFLLKNVGPDWSSDGRRLAFKSDRPRNVSAISMLTLDDRAPLREVRPDLHEFQRVRWGPDGSFTAQGTDEQGRQGIFRIDSKSGHATPVIVSGPAMHSTQASWTPDGRLLYRRESPGGWEVVLQNIESSVDRPPLVQCAAPDRIDGVTLSPDGTRLAWIQIEGKAKSSTIFARSLSGGQPVEVHRVVAPAEISSLLEWTPDGQRLVFYESPHRGTVGQGAITSVPAAGGAPVRVDGLQPQIGTNTLRIHRDGHQVAFSAGAIKLEVWTLTNFLPVARQR